MRPIENLESKTYLRSNDFTNRQQTSGVQMRFQLEEDMKHQYGGLRNFTEMIRNKIPGKTAQLEPKERYTFTNGKSDADPNTFTVNYGDLPPLSTSTDYIDR